MRRGLATSLGCAMAVGLVLVLSSAECCGVTIRIDGAGGGDYETIQEGIDAASFGDTVLVLPGTYHEHLTLGPGADGIALIGEAGPELTVVTGDSLPGVPVVRCEDVGASTLIQGLTFRAGVASGRGAGISCGYLASPRIVGNVIRDCRAKYPGGFGGGIGTDRGSPLIEENIIRRNRGIDGGGISIWGGSVTIRGNLIEDNVADGWGGNEYGGGIRVEEGSHVIEGNILRGNYALHSGGGIMIIMTSSVSLTSNTFEGNISALGGGGGLYSVDAVVEAYENIFTGNHSEYAGSAVTLSSWEALHGSIFEGNTFFGNVSDTPTGAAIAVRRGQSPIFRSNFFDNPTAFEVMLTEALEPDTLDFTGNWWGTNDPDSIAALIWDCNDDPGNPACVDFSDWCSDPSCAGQVTSVPEAGEHEPSTWSRIKSIYR